MNLKGDAAGSKSLATQAIMKAIDVASDTAGHAHELLDAGIQAVGLYLRPDRSSKAMVDGLHLVGIKCFSVYEKGQPTSPAYFTESQGKNDAAKAIAYARRIGQSGPQIFFAVDYDASEKDMPRLKQYFVAVRKILVSSGYLASVYGSGLVCKTLVGAGLAHSGWLAQSHGWAGFEDYKPHAAIMQGKEDTLLGFDIDWDTIVDPSVTW